MEKYTLLRSSALGTSVDELRLFPSVICHPYGTSPLLRAWDHFVPLPCRPETMIPALTKVVKSVVSVTSV